MIRGLWAGCGAVGSWGDGVWGVASEEGPWWSWAGRAAGVDRTTKYPKHERCQRTSFLIISQQHSYANASTSMNVFSEIVLALINKS